jgi:hypothetical protein
MLLHVGAELVFVDGDLQASQSISSERASGTEQVLTPLYVALYIPAFGWSAAILSIGIEEPRRYEDEAGKRPDRPGYEDWVVAGLVGGGDGQSGTKDGPRDGTEKWKVKVAFSNGEMPNKAEGSEVRRRPIGLRRIGRGRRSSGREKNAFVVRGVGKERDATDANL